MKYYFHHPNLKEGARGLNGLCVCVCNTTTTHTLHSQVPRSPENVPTVDIFGKNRKIKVPGFRNRLFRHLRMSGVGSSDSASNSALDSKRLSEYDFSGGDFGAILRKNRKIASSHHSKNIICHPWKIIGGGKKYSFTPHPKNNRGGKKYSFTHPHY